MFKTQKNVLITGYAAYVLYIFGFGIVFGPLEFSWAFYILAAMLGFAFYAMVSDYYPQTEAMEMTESPSDSARYIEDAPYARASICAILIFLLSITPLLITVSLNQRGIADISWFWQALIFLGGYVLQFVTTSIYKSCDSISVSGHVWYNDFSIRAASSTTTREDVLKAVDRACRIYTVIPSEQERAEAKRIVMDVMIPTLSLDHTSVVNDWTRVCDDLYAANYDIPVILEDIDAALKARYHRTTRDVEHFYKESSLMKQYIDIRDRYAGRKAMCRTNESIFMFECDYGDALNTILPTIGDWNDLVAESIHYIMQRSE